MNALQTEIDIIIEKRTAPILEELKELRAIIQSNLITSSKRLNSEQGAEYLGIKPDTLRRKVNSGQIPAKRVGNRWYFEMTDLVDFQNQ